MGGPEAILGKGSNYQEKLCFEYTTLHIQNEVCDADYGGALVMFHKLSRTETVSIRYSGWTHHLFGYFCDWESLHEIFISVVR